MAEGYLNRRNLRSARALAAKSLKDISAASGLDIWAISDFESGLTASLGEHAAAVERALAALGIRFEHDGSISLESPAAPPVLQAGEPFRWITAQDLSNWGGTRDGQEGLWLSLRIGRRTGDVRGIGQVFDEWSLATDPTLSADLLLGDRDEQATEVRRWLNGPPSVLSMQAEATDEAIAFLRAVIDPLPPSHRVFWESRFVVAGSDDAARNLLGLSAKLVIVLDGGDPGLARSLANDGHHVFVARGSEVGVPRDIPRLTRPPLNRILSGDIPKGEKHQ
jgi:hypothetical protein